MRLKRCGLKEVHELEYSFASRFSKPRSKHSSSLSELLKQGNITEDIAYSLLHHCLKRGNVELGRRLQSLLVQSGLGSTAILSDQLIRLFGSAGNLVEANQAFNRTLKPSQYTWNLMINANAKLGQGNMALLLSNCMLQYNENLDKFTFLSLLKACRSLSAIEKGRYIHLQISEDGIQFDVVVGSALLDMYAKCGNLVNACAIFDTLPSRDAIAWGTMIASYVQQGESNIALACFENMQHEHIQADKVIFSSCLKACGSIGAIELGRSIHEQVVNKTYQTDMVLGSSLIDMYAKCGSLEEARRSFDSLPEKNIVVWGAIITGYAEGDGSLLALECVESMQQKSIKPNRVIYTSILKACSHIGSVEQGRRIHEQLLMGNLQLNIILGSALVDMYAKCGGMEEAHQTFHKLANPNVVSWGAMITGYAQVGKAGIATEYFWGMQLEDIEPDDMAFSGIFIAFSRTGLMEEGLWYFKLMTEYYRMKPNNFHITCMVDLFGRAGCFKELKDLLAAIVRPEVTVHPVILRTLLSACNLHGNVDLARNCFSEIADIDFQGSAAYVLMSNIFAST